MSDNKHKREQLEEIYGRGSMFQKSKAEEYVETLPRIKGIKKYIQERRYSGTQMAKLITQMQYHHMKHKSEGGKTTIENGAVVNGLEHQYMHSLPRPQEEIINNHIRQWKVDFMTFTTERVINTEEITTQQPTETIEIQVQNYFGFSKKQLRRMRRRQEKRELREMIERYERGENER